MARILFVEDEMHFNVRHEEYLRDTLGHEVDVATHGSIAIAKLGEERYDLVILDIMMAQGDALRGVSAERTGIEILRRLRAGEIEGAEPQTPVIAFTAVAERSDRREIEGLGISSYLTKPVAFDQLRDAVNSALGFTPYVAT